MSMQGNVLIEDQVLSNHIMLLSFWFASTSMIHTDGTEVCSLMTEPMSIGASNIIRVVL